MEFSGQHHDRTAVPLVAELLAPLGSSRVGCRDGLGAFLSPEPPIPVSIPAAHQLPYVFCAFPQLLLIFPGWYLRLCLSRCTGYPSLFPVLPNISRYSVL